MKAISEKTIERQIIIWLWSQHILCTKVDNTGIYDAKRGQFRRNHGRFKRLGVSDIFAIYKGKALCIEVKSATGRLSEHQKEWLSDVQAHGGIAMVARSVEDVAKQLEQYDAGIALNQIANNLTTRCNQTI